MTNYKRFISYLYSYEAGTKKANVGFVRVESSNEICKLTVHCTTKQSAPRDIKIVLFKGQKDTLQGVEAGHAKAENGCLDAKLSFERGKLPQDAFAFTDAAGILLLNNKENYIAAKWDDSPVTYHEVAALERSGYQPKAENKKEAVVEDSNPVSLQDAVHEPQVIEVSMAEIEEVPIPETVVTESENAEVSVMEQTEGADLADEVEQPAITAQSVITEQPDVIEQPIEAEPVMSLSSEAPQVQLQAEPSVLQVESPQKTETEQEEERPEGQELQVEMTSFGQEEICIPEGTRLPQEQSEMVSAAGCPAPRADAIWVDHPSARLILNKFVRMYPFDDGEIAECVRLEPKDIGLLPMSTWVLGNNSFLLHSYCNFRHILFAKKLTRAGCEYLLMVPGVLNKHEEQLARMFGFQNFKSSRRRYARSGEFGYWYLTVNFNS